MEQGGETRMTTPTTRSPHGPLDALVPACAIPDTPTAIALEGGALLRLRSASPGDNERLRRMFYRLSPASIYHRLFLPAPQVPHWAERFAALATCDGELRYAVVALLGDEILGFANFGREVTTTREAELAIVVEDAWQGQGIGRMLIAAVVEQARRRAIGVLTARILADNDRALRLATRFFPDACVRWEDGEYALRICLERS
jgi:RimJ/RimL family protein N-acetyltransferase